MDGGGIQMKLYKEICGGTVTGVTATNGTPEDTAEIHYIEITEQEYEALIAVMPPELPTEPTDRIAELEQQNATLTAQIAATSTMMDFYEECIVEMAMIVYG
jgi:hypothetical protein